MKQVVLSEGKLDDGDGSGRLKQANYTQTFATAARTVAAATSAAVTQTVATGQTVAKTNTSPFGFSTGDADKIVSFYAAAQVDFAAIIADNTALRADVAILRGLVNSLIDDLQALGLAG